jgi:ABC-2 type transport system permease protein
MRPTLSLIRREFNAYFYSPIAYVVLAVFLAVTGHLFYLSLEMLTAHGPKGISYPMEMIVNSVPFWLVFVSIAPLLTMRLFAEEQSSGTLEMLLTAPVRDWQVVFAKFVACYGFYVLMWLPTLLYLPILTGWEWNQVEYALASWAVTATYLGLAVALTIVALLCSAILVYRLVQGQIVAALAWLFFGVLFLGIGALVYVPPIWIDGHLWTLQCAIDPWPVVTTYLGLALAGAMFLSIGLFISSLVKSQMIAALVALFFQLFFIVGGIWKPDIDTGGTPYKVLYYLTVPWHFEHSFGRGLIDTRNLILYGSVALLGLFLTVRSLESRRWR